MAQSDYIIRYILEQDQRRRMEQLRNLPQRIPTIAQVTAVPPPALGSERSKVIHITDLQDFCRCKRAWNWSSMLRLGLQPAVTPVPLFFGSAIHYALDYGYQDCIGQPVASFSLKAALKAFRH